ncbi:MAG: hypothetical protein AB1512_07375 [Thermodesulfobacteriota bacterium]
MKWKNLDSGLRRNDEEEEDLLRVASFGLSTLRPDPGGPAEDGRIEGGPCAGRAREKWDLERFEKPGFRLPPE